MITQELHLKVSNEIKIYNKDKSIKGELFNVFDIVGIGSDEVKMSDYSQNLLSQEALAKDLCVSFSTVNRWETGKSKPQYEALKKLKEFCEKNSIPFEVSEENFFIKGKC